MEYNMACCLKKYFKSLFYLATSGQKTYTVLLLCPGQIHAVKSLKFQFLMQMFNFAFH